MDKPDIIDVTPENRTENSDQEQKPQILDEQATGFFAILAFYRVRIALLMIIIGFSLFALQMLSAANAASPHKIFSWIIVRDLAEYNQMMNNSDESSEQKVPRTEEHYRGQPLEGFQERFDTFANSMVVPETLLAIPAQLREQKASDVVYPGKEPEQALPQGIGEPAYFRFSVTPDDANILLKDLKNENFSFAGAKDLIGPFPFDQAPDKQWLKTDGRELLLTQLPKEASAFQGLIISIREEITPNAYLVISRGDQTAADFAGAIRSFGQELNADFLEKLESDAKPELAVTVGFSDMRHPPVIYFATFIGELFVLIGGFLLFYHLFIRIASWERTEKGFVKNLFIDTCRLIRDNGVLYSITIGLFLLVWASSMVTGFLDPGLQQKWIQIFSAQLAGTSWPLGFAGQAYSSGNILNAAIATFTVNFIWGTFIILSILSMLPLSWAFIINSMRGYVIGLALAPTKLFFGQSLAPHLITMVVELQGYLIAGFASVMLTYALLKPQKFGCETRGKAFVKFAYWQLKVLPLIAIILAVAAIYEAVEIILLRYIL